MTYSKPVRGPDTAPLVRPDRFFFGTRALPCPYLPQRTERKVVTELAGPDAAALYERLSRAGFRRSHGLAYRPACPGCAACVPVRIRVADFRDGAAFRRIRHANRDIAVAVVPPVATVEQYRLFVRYQGARHAGGEMAAMGFADYRAMVEDTPVETFIAELRDGDGALRGAMLADRMSDSLSAVYSFFDARDGRRSLGSYMVLWLVDHCRAGGLDHVYLGYWIADSGKMAYKARFRPLERLTASGWELVEDQAGGGISAA